jgi:hypothetical protein
MPASDDLQVAERDVRLKELRGKYPGAEVWYVPGSDGHTEWMLRVHADSPEHLEESLRDAAVDGGLVTRE